MPANENLGEQFGADCPTCQSAVFRRESRGVLGKGKESFGMRPDVCGRPTAEGSDLCAMHLASTARMKEKLAAKRAWEDR